MGYIYKIINEGINGKWAYEPKRRLIENETQ